MPPIIYIILCLAIVAVSVKPLGIYIARVFMGRKTFMDKILGWLERLIYKICGIDADEEMSWVRYAGSMVLLGFFGFTLLYFILIFQHLLPLNLRR